MRERRLRALGHPKESTTPTAPAFRAGRSERAGKRRTACYDVEVLGLFKEASALHFDESGNLQRAAAFGTYRVLHQTGSGVLRPVFRAFDSPRDRLVAIKVFTARNSS